MAAGRWATAVAPAIGARACGRRQPWPAMVRRAGWPVADGAVAPVVSGAVIRQVGCSTTSAAVAAASGSDSGSGAASTSARGADGRPARRARRARRLGGALPRRRASLAAIRAVRRVRLVRARRLRARRPGSGPVGSVGGIRAVCAARPSPACLPRSAATSLGDGLLDAVSTASAAASLSSASAATAGDGSCDVLREAVDGSRLLEDGRLAKRQELAHGDGRLDQGERRAGQAARLDLVPAVRAGVLPAGHAEVEGLVERVQLLRRHLALGLAAGGGHRLVHRRVVGQDEVLQAPRQDLDALEARRAGARIRRCSGCRIVRRTIRSGSRSSVPGDSADQSGRVHRPNGARV